ncbi:MAG: M20/M25/M40 family metallo-hydrolase [Bacteroidota bacterium]|nr:M20/M25/M40 family metallo-hydrolase [Bacteroidota bacterium]
MLYTFLFITLLPACLLAQEKEANAAPAVADQKYITELTTLFNEPAIKKAFAIIKDLEPQTRKDHILLTQIPAPPFKEEKRGRKYMELLKAAGIDSVWVDKAGNVIGLRKGKKRSKKVVIEGHLDTVFPEGTDVTVKQRGDTLYAPGIGDDTRGLITVLTVLRAMQKAAIKTEGDIYFVGTTGEEGLGDLRGVKQLFDGSIQGINSYISVDGSDRERIVTGGTGSNRYRISFKGPGGHSYGAFGLANPHNASARAIYHFINTADSFTKKGVKTTYNIGMMGGGTSVNAIPFESWMEVDMRSESAERLKGIDTLLKTAVEKALAEENAMKRIGRPLTVEVKLIGERPTGEQQLTEPLIQRQIAVHTLFGARSLVSISSTNSNIPISKGVPAITIGGGGIGGGAHSLQEWWLNKEGYLGIQQALLSVVAEAGLAR